MTVKRFSAATGLVVASICSWPMTGAEKEAVPDLSGLWARQAFVYEPPSSGPRPLVNLTRRADGRSQSSQLMGDHTNPILKPHAAERVRRLGEISRTGRPFPDPSNQCQPMAPPYILANQGNQEIQLVQQRDQVLILHVVDHQVRRVRLNQSHPARVTPSWDGDSVGHYEGDTLVVDTVGFKVGPLSMVDIFGTPHTEALHVVERYRLVDYDVAKNALEWAMNEHGYRNAGVLTEGMAVDPSYRGKGLQIQFTVEDADVFTTPWSGSVTYLLSGRGWIESACAENVHDYSTGEDVKVPMAATPDF